MAYKRPTYKPFTQVAAIVKRHLRDVADPEIAKFAEDLKDRLVRGIYNQSFKSFKEYPLKEEYKKRKKKLRLDLRVMIASGEYVKSIKTRRLRKASYEIGVPEKKRVKRPDGSDAGITMKQLATINEKGSASAGIPPRPHWSIVLAHARKTAPSIAKTIAKKAMKNINKDLK